jgi:hypothetical protein
MFGLDTTTMLTIIAILVAAAGVGLQYAIAVSQIDHAAGMKLKGTIKRTIVSVIYWILLLGLSYLFLHEATSEKPIDRVAVVNIALLSSAIVFLTLFRLVSMFIQMVFDNLSEKTRLLKSLIEIARQQVEVTSEGSAVFQDQPQSRE